MLPYHVDAVRCRPHPPFKHLQESQKPIKSSPKSLPNPYFSFWTWLMISENPKSQLKVFWGLIWPTPVLKRIFEYIWVFEYFLPNIDICIWFVDIFRIRILFEYSNILVWIFRNYLMEKYLNFWETKTKFGQYSVSKE